MIPYNTNADYMFLFTIKTHNTAHKEIWELSFRNDVDK